jgi:hypothetical protein
MGERDEREKILEAKKLKVVVLVIQTEPLKKV